MGNSAGNNNQGENSIAMGNSAGNNNQGENSIAIGNGAGNVDQPANSIAIGNNVNTTAEYEIRIGDDSNNVVIPGTSSLNKGVHISGIPYHYDIIKGKGVQPTGDAYPVEQGTHIQWNRDGGSGYTYIMNQKGTGTGGISFGDISGNNLYSGVCTMDQQSGFSSKNKINIIPIPNPLANLSGVTSDINMWGTFTNTSGTSYNDNSPRQTATIQSGYSNQINSNYSTSNSADFKGAWGGEYLSFKVGNHDSDLSPNMANDSSMNPSTFSDISNVVLNNEVMRITAEGHVGIGTDSPTSTLDVEGTLGVTKGIICGDGGKGTGIFVGSNDGQNDTSNNPGITYDEINKKPCYIGVNYTAGDNEVDFHSISNYISYNDKTKTNVWNDPPGGFKFYQWSSDTSSNIPHKLLCTINKSEGMVLSGDLSGVTDITASGTITCNKVTDGKAIMTNGELTGVTDITASGALSGVTDLTLSGSLITNSGTITNTELSFLDGVKSNIQTQINNLENDTTNANAISANTVKISTNTTDIVLHTKLIEENQTEIANFSFANGNVGIGTDSPTFPLHVKGNKTAPESALGYAYMNWHTYWAGGSGWSGPTFGAKMGNISIFAEGAVATNTLIMYTGYGGSDLRIKSDITNISSDSSLEKIRLINPVSFNFKDKVNLDPNLQFGFIAQQVKDIIPDAVNYRSEMIPSIFKVGNVSGADYNIITINDYNIDDLYSDITDNIKVYSTIVLKSNINDTEHVHITEIINKKTIKVDRNLSTIVDKNNDIFVYGQVVDDFHLINKDTIWTMTVSALKEVDTQLQNTKQIIQEQETKIQEQDAKINSILQRLTNAGIE